MAPETPIYTTATTMKWNAVIFFFFFLSVSFSSVGYGQSVSRRDGRNMPTTTMWCLGVELLVEISFFSLVVM